MFEAKMKAQETRLLAKITTLDTASALQKFPNKNTNGTSALFKQTFDKLVRNEKRPKKTLTTTEEFQARDHVV